jgi:alpha-1,6-mannosyltransferase
MAANILSVIHSDRGALTAAARAHALQFSWVSSMEALFGRVYPAAFERRRERQLGLAAAAALAA